jgi:hypothetical protein
MAKRCHPVREHVKDSNMHGLTDSDNSVGC